jgi:hypothetical protein
MQLFFKSDPSGLEFKGSCPFTHDILCRFYNSTCYLFQKEKKKISYSINTCETPDY